MFGLLPADLKELDMLSSESLALLSCLFLRTHLPSDIQRDIVMRLEKNVRRNQNYAKFHRGTSIYAAKRRAKHVGKCWKCGALIHNGACRELPTTSQSECASALREDPVKLKAEGVLRPNSNASAMIEELVSLRISKLEPASHSNS